MERKTAARWLVVFALACFGVILFAGIAAAQTGATTIQGSNSSEESAAETGNADGENTTNFNAGPSAEGDEGASSQQLGSNSATVSQSGSAKTGDPVAGAQVAGAVADNVTIQLQNSATDPSAESGESDVDNSIDDSTAGPHASSDDGTAQTSQLGSNSLDLEQIGEASSGDAVAGSQVTGIVGGGEHTVSVQNTAICDDDEECADSGDATVENVIEETTAGPFADSDDGATAQAAQVGDNDAVLSQSSVTSSGDALFGSEVIGIVGGSATVQGSNSSECDEDPCAESGDVDGNNEIEEISAGPLATAAGGTGQVIQTGNNALDAAQENVGESGDALSGSQVLGAVGDDGGFLTEQLQQASDEDVATSGEVTLDNLIEDTFAGPFAQGDTQANASQMGDNSLVLEQTLTAQSGDALAAGQVVGAVGFDTFTGQNSQSADEPEATSGEVTHDGDAPNLIDEVFAGPAGFSDDGGVSVAQTGNNDGSIAQEINSASGDAVAGGQIAGIVGGTEVTIQNQQAIEDAEAESGDVDSHNQADDVTIGPFAEGEGTTQAIQTGDNALDGSQAVTAATGDAVGAGQVFGVVADDNAVVTISGSNACISDDGCAEVESGELEDGSFENIAAEIAVGAVVESDEGAASASQIGDNSAAWDQSLDGSTGDAVGGSQVAGAVTGDGSDVTIQLQNSADEAEVESGSIEGATNDLQIDVGPHADADEANAQAQQSGDNALDFSQDIATDTGDALAGSQVSGVVGPADATVQVSNSDNESEAESGNNTDVENNAAGDLGATAESDDGIATSQQNGDSAFDGAQDFSADTGDAVAGGQINGLVGGATLGLPGLNGA